MRCRWIVVRQRAIFVHQRTGKLPFKVFINYLRFLHKMFVAIRQRFVGVEILSHDVRTSTHVVVRQSPRKYKRTLMRIRIRIHDVTAFTRQINNANSNSNPNSNWIMRIIEFALGIRFR